MTSSLRSRVVGYAIAVLAVALALLIKWMLRPLIGDERVFLVFFGAVVVAGWFGGLGPGLLAVALAGLAADYLYLTPGTVLLGNPAEENAQLAIFALEGVLISLLSEARRRSEGEARKSEQFLQSTVDALRESEKRFRQLADNIDQIFWMANASRTKILYVSAAYERIFEKSCASLYENLASFTDRIVPEDRERLTQEFGRPSDNPSSLEYRILTSDGELRWLWSRAFPILNEQGEVDRIVGFTADVTDRKRAEESLRESDERFRQITKNIQEVFWITNPEKTRMIYISPGYERVWGRSCQSLYERPRSFLDAIVPEDRQAVEASLPEQAKGGWVREWRIRRPDGSLRWIWSQAFPVTNERGEVYRVCGITQDITERKQAEEALRESEARFRQLAENIQEVFWMTDPKVTGIVYISPAYEKVWGRSCRSLYENPMSFVDGIHPEDRPHVIEFVSRQDHLESERSQEYRVVQPDGSIRHIWNRAFPVRNERGEVYRIAGIAQDITERKRAEEQVRQHQAELARVLRVSTIGEMASMIAHEVNQPLAAMVNYARGCLLRIQSGDGESREIVFALEQICAQAERTSEIVRQLRGFVRKEAPRRTDADVNQLVRNIESLAASEAGCAGVRIRLELSADVPPVSVDVIQIEQVLLNLVRNSIEAMSETEPDRRDLLIRTSKTAEGHALITVRDAGRGIQPEDAERIFQSFYTTKREGTGLGLSISRSIVDAHGGRLWMATNGDPGTAFSFTLPAAPERSPNAP